jgi:hypothetical protein
VAEHHPHDDVDGDLEVRRVQAEVVTDRVTPYVAARIASTRSSGCSSKATETTARKRASSRRITASARPSLEPTSL